MSTSKDTKDGQDTSSNAQVSSSRDPSTEQNGESRSEGASCCVSSADTTNPASKEHQQSDCSVDNANSTQTSKPTESEKAVDVDEDDFANIFLHDWQVAVKRVDAGRRLIETLQSFMRERAYLEEMYAAGLTKLAKYLVVPPTESSGVKATVASIHSDATRRAQQANELAEAIKLDIVESTLLTTINNHHNVLRQIGADGATISRSFLDSVNEVRKAEREVARLGREAFQSTREGQLMSKSLSSQQTRLASKALTQIQELQEAEKRYRRCVHVANDTKRVYGTQMKVILRSLEDMDLKRLACFKDALRKLMIYQTSMLRNVQYDLDVTIQAVEELSEKSELKQFLEKSRKEFGLASSQSPDDASVSDDRLMRDFEVKHWSLLCLSPASTAEDSLRASSVPIGAASSARRDSGTGITVESATAAARTLLKKSPLDKVVQSAAAHLSSIGINTSFPSPSPPTSSSSSVSLPRPSTDSRTTTASSAPAPEVLLWLSGEADASEDSSRRSIGHEAAVDKIHKEYDELLDLVWNFTPESSETVWAGVESLREDLSSSLHRSIMVKSLDSIREKEKYQLPNMDALRILGCVAETLLEWCEKQWDVVNARAVMILVQKFYSKGKPADDPQGSRGAWVWPHVREKVTTGEATTDEIEEVVDSKDNSRDHADTNVVIRWFLYRVVYHLVIWNRVHFWEEALLFTISQSEQQKLLRESEAAVSLALGSPAEPTTSSRSSTVSSLYDKLLEKFGACMMAFGIVESQVTTLIQKVCREHNLPFEYSLSLLRCVAQHPDQAADEIVLPMAPFGALAHPLLSPKSSESKFERVAQPTSTMFDNGGVNGTRKKTEEPTTVASETPVNKEVNPEVQETVESEMGRHEVFDD